MDPRQMREINSSHLFFTKLYQKQSAQSHITPGHISKPLYQKFVPLYESSSLFKSEKKIEPNNEIVTQPDEPLSNLQKGSGLSNIDKTQSENDVSKLTTKDILEKMKNPTITNILTTKNELKVEPGEPVKSLKRKLVKPEGKFDEDWEEFKFY